MKTHFTGLQRVGLDASLREVKIPARPAKGWIRTVRKALGISTRQLAARMGVSQQAISQLEASEREDAATLKMLRKAAAAMECELAYVFVPRKSLESTVRKQALKKAAMQVEAVDRSMRLEAQGVGGIDRKIHEVAEKLTSSRSATLWDEDE